MMMPYRNNGYASGSNSDYQDKLRSIQALLSNSNTPQSEQEYLLRDAMEQTGEYDSGYLKTVLFPDSVGTPARIPTNFTMPTAIYQ
jgi:hypothetical protein